MFQLGGIRIMKDVDVKRFWSKVNIKTKEEFFERLGWAKQRIENLQNIELKNGLTKELEKLVTEFESRKIDNEEVFLREHFLFQAER